MATLQLWEMLKEAIPAYTGLSPATFFTVLALAFAFYYAISGFFSSSPEPRRMRDAPEVVEPLPPPVQLGEITEEVLKAYDGSDGKKPLLMAIKGQIYDVTQSRMFYGPGGPYALFAGKDASRALAKMSFEEKDLTGDISGLGPFEIDALQDWEYKFMSKYVKVGTIKRTVPVADAPPAPAPASDSVEAANVDGAKPAENGQSESATDEQAEQQPAKEAVVGDDAERE
ncbi:membrane steroid-binding protein 1-like [Telopea speciosissima]|uniref:membrane steroid-binding protein 1-like n=1 Tax=Telopea speciosissima TaxID=54955 RepID=UPI001CC7D94A|nr:membrane steroid-binding protein 1-like [Telopea speciosissima]